MRIIKTLAAAASAFILAAGPVAAAAVDAAPQSREQRQSRRGRTPPPPTAEEVRAGAQAAVTAASLTCQITDARYLGDAAAPEGSEGPAPKVYEAACADGPGYIVLSSTPPQTFECLQLNASAKTLRARDPAADVGPQCEIATNLDAVRVIGGYAKQANLACTVDQARVVGQLNGGGLLYEVGCSDGAGSWLETDGAGFKATPCLDSPSNRSCEFTTMTELVASFRPKLVGTDASACDVQQVAHKGRNSNGVFYEVTCAVGEGYILRMPASGEIDRVYPCSTADGIGGGCTLTTAAPTTEQQ